MPCTRFSDTRSRIESPFQAGRKVLMLQAIPAWVEAECGTHPVGMTGSFSLPAGMAVKTRDRKKLERLCRTIARPAVSEKRLEITIRGMLRYELKTPHRDGATGCGDAT